jgi:hypothetical protein
MKTISQIVLFAAGLASVTAAFALTADTTAPASAASPATTAASPQTHPHLHRLKARLQRRQLAARAIGRRLDLTGAQKDQLKTLRQKAAAEVRGIRQDTTLSPDQKKARIRETVQGARAQAGGVLTPEQKTQAAKLRRHLRRSATK